VISSARRFQTGPPGSISPKPPTPANLIESGVGIGNQTQRDRPFKRLIDEAALYATALSAAQILAHYQSQFVKPVKFQYAARFVCGKSAGQVVAPGVYSTAVNVHNPTYSDPPPHEDRGRTTWAQVGTRIQVRGGKTR
jgi:hypothetical protein